MFRRLSMTDNHISCLAIFIINLTENIDIYTSIHSSKYTLYKTKIKS